MLPRLFRDLDLKDHFRTFTRHPGIALGSGHKTRHPNSSLSPVVQSSLLFNFEVWADVKKVLML